MQDGKRVKKVIQATMAAAPDTVVESDIMTIICNKYKYSRRRLAKAVSQSMSHCMLQLFFHNCKIQPYTNNQDSDQAQISDDQILYICHYAHCLRKHAASVRVN